LDGWILYDSDDGKGGENMRRAIIWILPGTACLLVAAVFLVWKERNAVQAASLVVLDPSELRLTLAWNGQTIEAAPAATLPPSILNSRAYKEWQRRGHVTTLTGDDAAGNQVVASALGFIKDAQGVRRPLIPSIKVFSPNGTLINETSYSSEGLPETWTLYDPSGRKTQSVWYRTSGLPGTPFLRHVTFFDAGGTGRQFVANNPHRIVWVEWQVDSQGDIQGKLNGGRPELADAFLEKQARQDAPSQTDSDTAKP